MMNSRPYEYRPLRNREIRLLRLKKPTFLQRLVSNTGPAEPEIEIEHVSLDNPPQYEAISYT